MVVALLNLQSDSVPFLGKFSSHNTCTLYLLLGMIPEIKLKGPVVDSQRVRSSNCDKFTNSKSCSNDNKGLLDDLDK